MYVTPERLGTAQFLDFAGKASLAMVTVDEAHCISPVSYTHLDVYKRQMCTRIVVPIVVK